MKFVINQFPKIVFSCLVLASVPSLQAQKSEDNGPLDARGAERKSDPNPAQDPASAFRHV